MKAFLNILRIVAIIFLIAAGAVSGNLGVVLACLLLSTALGVWLLEDNGQNVTHY